MKSVMHSYSLTEQHVMRVKLMAQEAGLSEGLIVRNAIDLLHEHYALKVGDLDDLIFRLEEVGRNTKDLTKG